MKDHHTHTTTVLSLTCLHASVGGARTDASPADTTPFAFV